MITVAPPGKERPFEEEGLDVWGVHWSYDPGMEGGTFPTPGRHPVRELSLWKESVHFPDVETWEWDEPAKTVWGVDRDKFLVQGFVEMGLFERSYLLLGMEEALVAYLKDPDTMSELTERIADYKIDVICKLHQSINMDLLWYGDDWGTQSDMFLPPEIWRQVIGPHTERIYRTAKELGILVNQHSCGFIEPVIPDIVEMGADVWNPCQPCNDLLSIKNRFKGRLTLWGGIDSQFVLGKPGVTTREVEEEVEKRIYDLASGGGYIAAPSHQIPYPKHIQQAMTEAITRYGYEVYRDKSTQIFEGAL